MRKMIDVQIGTASKFILLVLLCALLGACGNGDGDDLDKFMAEAGNGMAKTVEALPQVQAYVPLQYNADAALNDPFKPRKAANKSSALQPNVNRPKEDLEAFPLESLKYVGTLSKNKVTRALIKTPDNTIYQVKVGNYIGPNFGLVTSIEEGVLQIKEIIQDDLSGDWVERNASINLQE